MRQARRFWPLAALLMAAACGGPSADRGDGQPPAGDPPSAATGVKTPTSPTPAADPVPRAAPSTPVTSAALPTAPEPPVNDDPQQFLTQSPDTIAAALGDPSLIRRDGPAEVWQYAGRGCVLDLYLYKTESGGFATKHVELRSAGLPDAKRRDCLAKMLRDRIRKTG